MTLKFGHKLIGIFVAVFLILIILMRNCGNDLFNFDPDEYLCQAYEQDQFLVVEGVVDSVFEDKENHSANTLKVRSGENIQTIYLEYDKSGLFEYLQKGDSIFKEHKSYKVIIKRVKKERVFTLDYGIKC